jgi:hypothetical protein
VSARASAGDVADPARLAIEASELGRAGGAVVTTLLDGAATAALREEAFACHALARESYVGEHDGEDGRGGSPDRWLETAVGGVRLRRFFASRPLRALLRRLTGLEWTPTGAQGTYSYYRRPGHYLGIHRDVRECDLAVITCLHDAGDEIAAGEPGALVIYPGRTHEPLSAIRAHPAEGAVPVHLAPGQSAIVLGGMVPHRVAPVVDGQLRVVTPLCYRVAGP